MTSILKSGHQMTGHNIKLRDLVYVVVIDQVGSANVEILTTVLFLVYLDQDEVEVLI